MLKIQFVIWKVTHVVQLTCLSFLRSMSCSYSPCGCFHVEDTRFFSLCRPVKVTSCLRSALLMPTTVSWWASPVNPATDTSSSWTTWTLSRRSKRSWWPLCVRQPRPVSNQRLSNNTSACVNITLVHKHTFLFFPSLSICADERQHNTR